MSANHRKAPPEKRPGWWKAAFRWLGNDAPVLAIVAISFVGSYGHIIELAEKHGQHGIEAKATAAVVDLFCYVMAMERQRDRSIGRPAAGPLSLPSAFLVLGVVATLAINLATAGKGGWGHVIAAIPPAGLILAIIILERRKSFVPAGAEKAEPGRNRRRGGNPGSTPVPAASTTSVPVPGSALGSGSGSASAGSGFREAAPREPQGSAPAARRSVEQLAAEGRDLEARMGQKLSAKRLRAALACNYQDARAAARVLHPEDYDDAGESEAVSGD